MGESHGSITWQSQNIQSIKLPCQGKDYKAQQEQFDFGSHKSVDKKVFTKSSRVANVVNEKNISEGRTVT